MDVIDVRFIFSTDCGTDYKLDNGHINFNGKDTTVNSTVSVSCNPGYNIVGDNHITCTPDGTWTKSTKCVIKGLKMFHIVYHFSSNLIRKSLS